MQSKTTGIVGIVGIAMVIGAGIGAVVIGQMALEQKEPCNYEPYRNIEKGMETQDVVDALGQPRRIISKGELPIYGLDDEFERQLDAVWHYTLSKSPSRHIEIYFDAQEKVLLKICGNS